MRWVSKDIDQYYREKEYIDTIVIPLIPVTWKSEIKSTVESGEFTVKITEELEKQLKGRIVQFPPFTYLKSENPEQKLQRLQVWKEELLQSGMEYIFYLTSDVQWKNNENLLGGSLIWLPSIPMQHMDFKYEQEIVSSQMKQILEIVTNKWQNGYNYE
jgi:hypothetical protein